ncbi:hypothetical protein BaRGS_00032820 [Batillaria attramentaria]|uniref:Uncharacterized protein n=1 Tax=Batillaria attramentaria TaxID=370345 RepID=A0ABD0JMB8_9CAEN
MTRKPSRAEFVCSDREAGSNDSLGAHRQLSEHFNKSQTFHCNLFQFDCKLHDKPEHETVADDTMLRQLISRRHERDWPVLPAFVSSLAILPKWRHVQQFLEVYIILLKREMQKNQTVRVKTLQQIVQTAGSVVRGASSGSRTPAMAQSGKCLLHMRNILGGAEHVGGVIAAQVW